MRVSSQPPFVFFLEQSNVYSRLTDSLNWAINLSVCGVRNQHPIVWTLPCLVTFIWNFILTWKCQKWYWDTGTLIYKQLRFANLSALLQFYNKYPLFCALFGSSGHCPIILDYSLQLYTPTFADYILLSHHHLIYNHNINFCLSHDDSVCVEHVYGWLFYSDLAFKVNFRLVTQIFYIHFLKPFPHHNSI